MTTDAYRFYEFVGFKLVGERQIAVDNPAWDGAPVTIRIVRNAYCYATVLQRVLNRLVQMLRESHAERVREKRQ